MESLLLIGAFEAFFIALLLSFKRPFLLHDRILMGLFWIFFLTIFLSWIEIYNRKAGYPWPWLIHTSPPLILLHGPGLWFYIQSLTRPSFRFRTIHLFHFLPFVILVTGFALETYSLPADIKINMEISQSFQGQWLYPVGLLSVLVSTQGYNVWGIYLLRQHKKRLKSCYSETEKRDLKWLKFLLSGTILSYALISILYIADYLTGLMPYGIMQVSGYSVASLFILILGFYGFRQGDLFLGSQIKLQAEDIPLSPNDLTSIEQRLRPEDEVAVVRLVEYMKTKKPYLEPELTLTALSQGCGLPSDYLSSLLNQHLGVNFYDFVNQYRIDEFKQQLQVPENRKLTLVSIAFDSGFQSKATFNRVFKKVTGLTPSEYMRKVSTK